MEIEVAKVPMITGAPGRHSCAKAMAAVASATTWVKVPATETGDMAPPTMNGEMMHACPARA